MKTSPLKKIRLKKALTQAEVAERVGVSQPNYQRWESGTSPIPNDKIRKLAKALACTIEEVEGKPKPFDLFNINKSIGNESTYYGEVTFHFKSTNKPLVLPISIAEMQRLSNRINNVDDVITVKSLDNRNAFIFRHAIVDIYLCSEAEDNFGPEKYIDFIDPEPNEEIWSIIEKSSYLDYEELLELYSQEWLDRVPDIFLFSNDEIRNRVNEKITDEDDFIKKVEESRENSKVYSDRASMIIWQSRCGKERKFYVMDSLDMYYSMLDIKDMDENIITLQPEDYDKCVFISKHNLDYITFPSHLYNEGLIRSNSEFCDKEA